ncbi:MAG: SRPBCC family protein [Nocardioidaceae bacterium]
MTIQQQKQDDSQSGGGLKSVMDELPFDRLKDELQGALKALGEKGLENVGQRISGATDSLNDMAENGGVMGKAATKGATAMAEGENPVAGAAKGAMSGVKDKVKSAFKGGGGKSNKATKSTNIIESIDVGVPIDVAYNQWTQFQDFSGFMKKVDNVEQNDDNKVTFKAQVFWSHRTWESTILEQVPDERIVWRSKGAKGHVDGAVSFHELAPNMTRILVVLEYYPQGLFERTGNIWRAQGRRARLELKHFRRHVMTRTILNTDDLEGWRGEIHEGKVTRSHEEVVEEEQRERDEENGEDQSEDGYDEGESAEEESEEPEDEYDEEGSEDEPEDEYEEDEDAEEPEDESEEYEDEEESEDEGEEEPVDEYEEDEEESDEEGEEPEDEYEEDEYDEESEGDEEEEPEDEDRAAR